MSQPICHIVVQRINSKPAYRSGRYKVQSQLSYFNISP